MSNSIGDQLAFPIPGSFNQQGMTYRQWLIGQALASGKHVSASTMIYHADEILRVLEGEKQNETHERH